MPHSNLLAAVDLGSNSFRLEISRIEHDRIQRVQYLKETVRLGAGLDAAGNLSAQAMQRGWDCLARFAERLRDFAGTQVRAVATQTLREAHNREIFIARASALLGHPIEVIDGAQEAELIYQGVSRLLPDSDERRLVLDIGGRSTELILGQRQQARTLTSLPMGSVSWAARHFADGALTPQAFAAARASAQALLEPVLPQYPRHSWDMAYGSSGTMGAVGDVLAAGGHASGWITRNGLGGLLDRLLRAGHSDHLRLDGLKEDRRPVIGGGLSVLLALFDLLGLERLQVAQGALRQGVLYQLLQQHRPDAELHTSAVAVLMQRFGVDSAQAQRVARVACTLLAQAQPACDPASLSQLGWAAQLHEIGCRIARSGYHRHGAYILDNTDATGLTPSELHRLSLLIRSHRGKLRKLEPELDWDDALCVLQLACLRLAVALCHARRDPDLQGLLLQRQGARILLHCPPGWAQAHPQSAHLVQKECQDWERSPWSLTLIKPSPQA